MSIVKAITATADSEWKGSAMNEVYLEKLKNK